MPTTVHHFLIHGCAFVKLARDRMFERGWEDAIRFITDSIPELGFDYAVDILRGIQTLDGCNEFVLKPEEWSRRNEVTNQSHWYWAGTVFDGKYYWRPYATVDNWGPNDILGAASHRNRYAGLLNLSPIGGAVNARPRDVHYMDDKENDRGMWLIVDSKDKYGASVLWQQVDSTPVWMKIYNNMQWQQALNDYMTIGAARLDKRGHFQWYKDSDKSTFLKANFSDHYKQPEPTKPAPISDPDKELNAECGWILPDGSLYSCVYGEHTKLADSIWYHKFGKDIGDVTQEGERAGWIKLQYMITGIKRDYLIMHYGDRPATPEQVLTIQLWCKKHNESEPYWLKENTK